MASHHCSVEIRNNSSNYVLTTPCVLKVGGSCEVPLPPMLFPGTSDKALFKKYPDCKDNLGVLFAHVLMNQKTKECKLMAVVFGVPYDPSEKNAFVVGVFGSGTVCDDKLFQSMREGKEAGFVRANAGGAGINFKSSCVSVHATMSESKEAILKVDVSDVCI